MDFGELTCQYPLLGCINENFTDELPQLMTKIASAFDDFFVLDCDWFMLNNLKEIKIKT